MVRLFTLFGALMAGGIAMMSGAVPSVAGFDIAALFRPADPVTPAYQRGFRSDFLLEINEGRLPHGLSSVRVDEEVQAFVVDLLDSESHPASLDLERVFDALQEEFPGAQYLAANLVTGRSREDLIASLRLWEAVANPDFDILATAVVRKGRRYTALGVMARRIPRFSLALANRTGGRFYNHCPHCDSTHALSLDRRSRTLILSCPDCESPFDVLASDSRGRMRRANAFFSGFSVPDQSIVSGAQSGEERVLAIWQQIASRCRYEADQRKDDTREAWKTPVETWTEKAGDCEDTSILLADALMSAGFESRVAIGWNGNIGQHAWCVVNVEGTQYVLESTLAGELDHTALVPVEDASAYYKPEQLFDREHLYFSAGNPAKVGEDYFSRDHWRPLRVDPGEEDARVTSRLQAIPTQLTRG